MKTSRILLKIMRKLLLAVIVAIVANCVCERVEARDFYPYRNVSYSASLGGGISLVENNVKPVAGLRFGVEFSYILAEIEFSYLAIDGKLANADEKNISTMTAGLAVGAKFVQGYRGYLAGMIYTGSSLQGSLYDYGGYCDYYRKPRRSCGKPYLGLGLQGVVDFNDRIGCFIEARYQTVPVKGFGDDKWGLVTCVGLRCMF